MDYLVSGIDLRKIKFDFHKELNEIARIVKSDISETVRSGKGVTSSGTKATLDSLDPKTIHRKGKSKDSRIRKNATRPLVGTGSMINLVIEEATKGNQTAKLAPGQMKPYSQISKRGYPSSNATAYEVAGYQQAKRHWFGVSKDADKRITNYMSMAMDKILSRA